jgi:myb proto-oncogene protein
MQDTLNHSIDGTNGSTGKWAEDEDCKLKDAVKRHGGKNWAAIAALIPVRTEVQCRKRWHNALNPSIALTTGRGGKWTADEDIKLKNAVQTHGGKNWAAISALFTGRTKLQCSCRWHNALDPSITLEAGCTGKWVEDEDTKLKDAAETHGGKNWGAIATLIPGRTIKQCNNRWHDVVNPSIDQATGLTGKWTEDEDSKLKDAVLTHGGKNWVAIAALIPGRTRKQCNSRWKDVLDPSIGRASGVSCSESWKRSIVYLSLANY